MQTVHGLGKLKDHYFTEQLEQHGVEVYEAAIALVRTLRAQEIKTAVVSSSNNCAAVLEAAGISQLFDARVDGIDITRLTLNGKPAPDAFLEAARRLKTEPSRAVVVEDAIAGVEAGTRRPIRLRHRRRSRRAIAGAARGRRRCCGDQPGASQDRGRAAFRVVTGVSRTSIRRARASAKPCAPWATAISRRAGRQPGRAPDDIHYPGTYLAGGYNRLRTDIAGRVVENEDLVNLPNWLALEFRIADEDWFDAQNRQDPVLSPGARSPARHAAANHKLRGSARGGAPRSRSAAWSR